MEYKLIAMDMDGTLLNSNKEVSERNLKAIDAAIKKGIHVVLATGRVLSSAQHYAKKLDLKNYIIASNGAIIVDSNNKIVFSKPLDVNLVNRIIEIGNKYSVYNHFYDENTLYSNTYVKEIVEYYRQRESDFKFTIFKELQELLDQNEMKIYKFIFIDDEPKKLQLISEELQTLEYINLTKSFSNNIEVMNIEASKGEALKFLGEKLNVPRDQIIAVGDNENDLTMIQYAGLGVAMGNGEEIVKDSADYVTLNNDEDGIAKVIEKFIL